MPDFTYNASALGAGGVIERGNVKYTIPSLASVALAPTGGEGRTVVSNYHSEEVSFSHAETRVFGSETKSEWFTTSTYVLIRNLRVFDKLSVGEMRAVVTSERGFEQDDDHPFSLEVSYRDVRVRGSQAIAEADFNLLQASRYRHLEPLLTGAENGEGIRKTRDPEGLAKRFNANSSKDLVHVLKQKKPVQGSVMESVELDSRKHGPTIYVPGLGYVRFAELMIKPGRRRLNLIRILFGPRKDESNSAQPFMMAMAEEGPDEDGPTGGSFTLGSTEGNGIPVEP